MRGSQLRAFDQVVADEGAGVARAAGPEECNIGNSYRQRASQRRQQPTLDLILWLDIVALGEAEDQRVVHCDCDTVPAFGVNRTAGDRQLGKASGDDLPVVFSEHTSAPARGTNGCPSRAGGAPPSLRPGRRAYCSTACRACE